MVALVCSVPFRAMASDCEIRLAAPDEEAARALAAAAIDEVARIETAYSRYRPDSQVARINAQAGRDPVECDAETCQLLDYADHLYHVSAGLFDITSGVLRRAWDFQAARLPEPGRLDALLPLVDWPSVRREGRSVLLPRPGMEIDFGGFGKEYAAECAAAVLVRLGVRHGFVNLGGDMRFIGPQPDGQPWRIGIRHPREPDGVAAGIDVAQGALATSGDYERFFDLDGRRYCHVLNPRTGMPVSHWRSVSVLAPLAILAGSVTTIAMLKETDALSFLTASGVSYFAIDAEGRAYYHRMNGDSV